MPENTNLVTINRGRYSSYFQVTRAWLSAASALAMAEPGEAIGFIESAIQELKNLKAMLGRAAR